MARFAILVLLVTTLNVICNAAPSERQEAFDVTTTSDRWSWTDCSDGSFPVHIESIEIYPDPPEKGKDMTVTVVGTADKQIEEGAYADVVVKVGAIKLLQKEFDVCEEARGANASIQCPVAEGKHQVIHTVTLPKEIPPAPFAVSIRGYTVDDEDMACVEMKIDFRPQRPRLLGW
ncbi:uncharacterized protein LAESUDRAFT_813183 [Laetiporus sulphureus 93-53]|uniref:Phosphatidylglycerol/phosphatidylinositol transfer protein n=1 Tax=Laetiporus sulphureus 93-53 TaxID=1314785 RepID=A0A165DZF6_9APHY|nr:uncharacterized protein LAESUDRAFT_813183 [Laetiporus sulphureus 93-53]KZT05952.1 hypothetical protein LAESUDRAFT_813183 [Laetiporus sulphureus 93-53]